MRKVEGRGRWAGWTLWMDEKDRLVSIRMTKEAERLNLAHLDAQVKPKPRSPRLR